MKVSLIIAILVAVMAIASCVEEDEFTGPSHLIEKREAIIAPAALPSCGFYECSANCRRRGYWKGGYCTINGCQCIY